MTNVEFVQKVIKSLQDGSADIQTDNIGHLIIYTGFFEQKDSSIQETEDPEYDDG